MNKKKKLFSGPNLPSYKLTQVDNITVINGVTYNSIVQMDATHFAVASGGGGSGWIKVFEIDGSYNITEIKELEHYTARNAEYNAIVKLDATHIAVAFAGFNSDGYIKVFSFDGSWNITEESSLEHDTSQGVFNSMFAIDSTHVFLNFSGYTSDGICRIFSFAPTTWAITQESTLTYNNGTPDHQAVSQIDATRAVILFRNDSPDSIVRVISWNPTTYALTNEPNSLNLGAVNISITYMHGLLSLSTTEFFAVATNDNGMEAFTFTIDGSNVITQKSNLLHTTDQDHNCKVAFLDETDKHWHVALIYSDNPADDGRIKIFRIRKSNYAITEIFYIQYENDNGNSPDIEMITDANNNHVFVIDQGNARTFIIDK